MRRAEAFPHALRFLLMKILVFSDIHGSLAAADNAVAISRREKPDKTVVCGDIFGWSSYADVSSRLLGLEGVLYFLRGNNDWQSAVDSCPLNLEDSAVMRSFGRTLFFTHGDRYNGYAVPPFLKEGDALVYGHTHVGSLRCRNGLFLLNVGSLARPRDGAPDYLVLDERGAQLKSPDGEIICSLAWDGAAF